MIKQKLTKVSRERFWSKVSCSEGCWLWTGAKTEKGYGVFGIGKETDKAHRIAWRLSYGPIPKCIFVLHKCDTPACVRPEHLFLGTNQDNVNDMIRKGRNSPPPPMGGWNRKELPQEFIPLLGKMSDADIARKCGFNKTTVQRKRRRLKIAAFPCQTRFKRKEV